MHLHPYFWAISENRDMTFTPKIYTKENLLVLHEYRHAFKDSFLLVDSSYTSGYKKTNKLKSLMDLDHIFLQNLIKIYLKMTFQVI